MSDRDPLARRFMDWWFRNEERFILEDVYWPDVFDEWMEPFGLDSAAAYAMYLECSDEFNERRWRMAQREPQGMIVTDLSQWEEAA
jgi:hypothetical protein